jgi:DsbC/DsbD-like thiol-disulfide interchange protein
MNMTLLFRSLLLAMLCLLPLATQAQDAASPWVESNASRVRLLSTGAAADGKQPAAALEILLDPGFKTYWRNPGESGVPPLLTTDGSENLRSAELLFPVPRRQEDETGISNIYDKGVVLPLLIHAIDPAKPVRLKGLFQFGVCDKLCIPAEAVIALELGGKPDQAQAGLLDAALALLPVRGGSKDHPTLFPLREAKMSPPDRRKQAAELVFDGGVDAVFAEGPEGWFAEAVLANANSTGSSVVHLALYGPRQNITLSPCPVRITLSGKSGSIERLIPLDRCTSQP